MASLSRGGKKALRAGGVVVLVLVSIAGWFVVDLLADAGAFRSIEPHAEAACEPVGGVLGSEDLDRDPLTGLVYVSSGDMRTARTSISSVDGSLSSSGAAMPDGAILVYDGIHVPWRLQLDFEGWFQPHGIDLLRTDGGELLLFVVNHPGGLDTTVEVFAVEGDRGRHLRTIRDDAVITSANDIVALSEDRQLLTLDAGTRPDAGVKRVVETFGRRPWAGVALVDGDSVRKILGGMAYANGINLSHDGSTVYVAESSGRRLSVYDLDEEQGTLTLRGEHGFDTALDNIIVAADGSLWIGAHPQMLKFLGHAGDPAKLSPSQVLRITIDADGTFGVGELLLDDGSSLSGSSVAQPVPDGFVVGSVFEEHMLHCRTDEAAQWTPEASAPHPFSPAEIRGATADGRRYTFRMDAGGDAPATFRTMELTEVTDTACTVGGETWSEGSEPTSRPASRFTWQDLWSHATYPAQSTTIEPEQVTVGAGTFACQRYSVRDEPDGELVTRAWFAGDLPGAPVKMEAYESGALAMTMTLVEHHPSLNPEK